MAEELLDRALYALEMSWHPSFNPAAAACRLDYELDENKALFTALFRHTQVLSRGWAGMGWDCSRGRSAEDMHPSASQQHAYSVTMVTWQVM